jgi:hypothetical protein
MNLFDHNYDISRGRNNDLSKIANQKINKVKGRELVLNLIDGNRSTKDITSYLQTDINKISGRFTELKKLELIEFSHSKEGFSVYKQIIK